MKVMLLCSTDLNKISGSQIRARLIADGLLSVGVEIGIVAAGIPIGLAARCEHCSVFDGSTNWMNLLYDACACFKPDVIYVITEAFTDIALAVARKFNKLLAIDLHGIGVVEIMELGSGYGARWPRIRDSLRCLSVVPKADIVTIANPKLSPIISLFARRKLDVIGMTDIELYHPHGLTYQLGKEREKIQVLYAGNYLLWQGIDLLMGAIQILNLKGVPCEFTLLGEYGRDAGFFERWSRILNSRNVHLVNKVNYEEVPCFFRGADILVIPRPVMLSTFLAFPQKLVDYLSSGRTVVATDLAPHRWALEQNDAGILCMPSAEGVADGICAAMEHGVRERLGEHARILAEELFCHHRQCRLIYSAFCELVYR